MPLSEEKKKQQDIRFQTKMYVLSYYSKLLEQKKNYIGQIISVLCILKWEKNEIDKKIKLLCLNFYVFFSDFFYLRSTY